MDREKNGMAVAGFMLSTISLPLFVVAFLCMIQVLLFPFMAVIFGEAAGLIAVFGIVLSAIGNARSYNENTRGAGLSIAGLLVGTVVLTLVLSATALWISTTAMGFTLLPALI